MRLNIRSLAIAALLIGSAASLAMAGNTVLFSSSKGDLTFPLSPPDSSGNPGLIDNMTIGATTPRGVNATTLTATTKPTGAGIAALMAAPGAIGGTTPAGGSFTTLSASSTVSGTGFSTYLASAPAIGGTVPATGAFTALSGTTSVTGGTGSFTTLTVSDQISSTAGAPSVASGNCGATTNGSAAGTNQSGTITIGSATTTTCQVDFSKTLGVAPKACLIFPANATAAAVGTTIAYVSAITTAHFIVTGSALASANYYFICL